MKPSTADFKPGDLVVVRECNEIAPYFSGVHLVLFSEDKHATCVSMGLPVEMSTIYTVLTPRGTIVKFWDINLEAY